MTESHDPWEKARERQRREVAEIFAKRESRPAEGRARERLFTRRRLAVLAGLAVLGAIVAAVTVPGQRRDAAAGRAVARAQQRTLEAAERARLTADVRPRFATGPVAKTVAARAGLIAAGEAAITAEARKRMKAGTISGPVAGTHCHVFPTTPTRRALERDPAQTAGRYSCVAYEREIPLYHVEGRADTGYIGVPFWLVAHYATGRLAFCKITPRPSEGGQSLVDVEVPVACKRA